MHSFKDRALHIVPFLGWFGPFITFDRDFLVVGIFFLRCKRVVTIYNCCFVVLFVVDFWSEEIFVN
jgi:hypothetical protein